MKTKSAPCKCCSTVLQYIAEHLDPLGLTLSTDDPAETFAIFKSCFPGEDLGITVEDVADYIADLTA